MLEGGICRISWKTLLQIFTMFSWTLQWVAQKTPERIAKEFLRKTSETPTNNSKCHLKRISDFPYKSEEYSKYIWKLQTYCIMCGVYLFPTTTKSISAFSKACKAWNFVNQLLNWEKLRIPNVNFNATPGGINGETYARIPGKLLKNSQKDFM